MGFVGVLKVHGESKGTSLVGSRGDTVEVKMDLYQPREIANFGGRAVGVRTRVQLFSD